MPRLTSADMLDGPDWLEDECAQGYKEGCRPINPYPGSNRSPAYIHGFNNALRDKGRLPSIGMHEIVATWNLIVVSETR